MNVGMELQLQEEIHDVHYLHNETLFAAAQAKYTYIYDSKGVEIHCMKRHERPLKLDYLPYHFLLTTVGHSGWIKWHDVSVGEYVAGYQTGHGPVKVLKHNPVNAVSHVGHSNGVVSLWSPTAGKALVSIFCHKSPVTDLAIDREGKYMATAGLDGYLKVICSCFCFVPCLLMFCCCRFGIFASWLLCTRTRWTTPLPLWTFPTGD
jgi:U3 small nucleolar RNA-associated protein 7